MTENSRPGPIVIAGGSGFLGVSLAFHLAALGHSIVILSRRPPKVAGQWKHVTWDARSLGDWSRELDGASGLVNLVGRSVDCIKTPEHQDEILRSRLRTSMVIRLKLRVLKSHLSDMVWHLSWGEPGKKNFGQASFPPSVR
jgi:NAD dependent epimerase/dehydratase family enzyme